jgi:hypothetical protein
MRGDRQDGILRLGDLKTMVKIVLAKEGSGQPENGKGGVASLREHLKQSRQLLQERIAP